MQHFKGYAYQMLQRLSDILRRIVRYDVTRSVSAKRRLWEVVRAEILAYNTGIFGYARAKHLERKQCS